jgi:hypothetical protein
MTIVRVIVALTVTVASVVSFVTFNACGGSTVHNVDDSNSGMAGDKSTDVAGGATTDNASMGHAQLEGSSGTAGAMAPPAPVSSCPPNRPAEGSSCRDFGALPCQYATSFCEMQADGWTTYECIASVWKATSSVGGRCTAPPIEGCPALPPSGAQSCVDAVNVHCPYCYSGLDGGRLAVIADCTGDHWRIYYASVGDLGSAVCRGVDVDAGFDAPIKDGGALEGKVWVDGMP